MSGVKPIQRLHRMRRMFAKEGGILAEDYDYFMQPAPADAATLLSIDFRKLAQLRERRGPRQN